MITLHECRQAQCDNRLALKTQDQALVHRAMEGAGMTRWEAQVLPQVVEEIYFSGGQNRPWKEGQIQYQCVDIKAGAGVKVSECALRSVNLTLMDTKKDLEVLRGQGAIALRRSKLMRITEEAREQGGVLTQEDIGLLLCCDQRTIRRDIKELKAKNIFVPTRGFVKDIGPTLTHKAQAIRHWLEGKEPVAIARTINHSVTAVERYLEDFKRVAFLEMKGLDEVAISRATTMSLSIIKTYREMYQEAKSTPKYGYRFRELETMNTQSPESPAPQDGGKKGAK